MIFIPIQDCTINSKPGKCYGPEGKCYPHDGTEEGIAAAIEKAKKQGQAIEISKHADASGEPSLEYLRAFHKFVKGHVQIYGALKDEIHKRARGSAGGQAKAASLKAQGEDIELQDILEHPPEENGPVKASNAAYVEGEIVETDEYIDAPTVFAKEGVFKGVNGIPTKKTYESLKASAPWFVGAPITPKHIETDIIRPTDRRLGHIISASPRDDQRDVFGYSRYFKDKLTPDELGKIRNKQYPDGSIGYFTITKPESGQFDGKQYDAVEDGNYVITEYATFFDGTKGACSREQGCGPFQNASGLSDSEMALILEGGEVKQCPKKLNEARRMSDEIEAVKADYEKRLNASQTEVEGLKGTISELKSTVEAMAGQFKTLNEAFQAKQTAEVTAKDAAQKDAFRKQLNAASVVEVDTLWAEVKGMNPVEYDTWKINNTSKLLNEAEKKDLTGKKQANAAGFDLAVEQAKIFNY